MEFQLRELLPAETRTYLEVHRIAVRGSASSYYPPEVIDAWAPLPITRAAVEAARRNSDDEVRIAAVVGGRIIGVGAFAPGTSELRACYVLPEASHSGVGAAIVAELEGLARSHRTSYLRLDASLNAVSFYAALGYEVTEAAEHVLSSGVPMACVRMRKAL